LRCSRKNMKLALNSTFFEERSFRSWVFG
jgi:hypothetical protein